jgi:hypothetical protein
MSPKNRKLISRVEALLVELDLLSLTEAARLCPYSASRLYALSQDELARDQLPFVRLPLPGDSARVKDRIFVPRGEVHLFEAYRRRRGSEAATLRNQRRQPKAKPTN